MKVYGWPSDSGACKFFRTAMPMVALDALDGWEARMPPDGITRLPTDIKEDPDWFVVLQRSYNPSARATMALFGKLGRPFGFDVDDNLWAVERDNPAWNIYSNPNVLENLTWMVRNAAVVTCSTEPLADHIRGLTDRPVVVLHNALDLERIDPDLEEREPTVLWRGSPTHDRDVDLVGYALRKAEASGVRVVLAGQDYRARLRLKHARMLDDLLFEHPDWAELAKAKQKKVPSERNPTVPRRAVWLSPVEYLRAIRQVVRPTVALCPLRSSVFNDSKSHIAALEANAAGVVAIASDTPPYRWYLEGGGGILVRNGEQDWHRALQDVLSLDYAGWRDMAAAGVTRARETSVEALTPLYAETYEKAAAG